MQRRSSISLIAIAAFAALLAFSLGITASAVRPYMLPVLILAAASIAVALWAWTILRDLTHPIFLLIACVVVLYVLRPVAAFGENYHGQLGYDFLDEAPRTLWIVTAGCATAYGAFAIRMVYLRAEQPPGNPRRSIASIRIHPAVEIGVVGIAVLAFAWWLVGQGGGVSFIFSGRSSSTNQALRDSSAYLYFAPQTVLPLGILRLVNPSSNDHSWNRTIALAEILFSQIASLGFGNRIVLLPAAFALLLLAPWRDGKYLSIRSIVAVGFILFVLVITLPRELRVNAGSEAGTVADAIDILDASTAFLQGQDTAMIDNLSILVMKMGEGTDFAYGQTYLAAAVKFVPRTVWPTRPRVADEQINSALFKLPSYNYGFSFGYFGEPYYNFGVSGVIAAGGVAGWAVAFLGDRARRTRSPISMTVCLVSVAYIVIYMRGGIGVDYHRQLIMLSALLPIAMTARKVKES